ncbi:hypothetical protein KI387_027353, partial [Taxus chinensis]
KLLQIHGATYRERTSKLNWILKYAFCELFRKPDSNAFVFLAHIFSSLSFIQLKA